METKKEATTETKKEATMGMKKEAKKKRKGSKRTHIFRRPISFKKLKASDKFTRSYNSVGVIGLFF